MRGEGAACGREKKRGTPSSETGRISLVEGRKAVIRKKGGKGKSLNRKATQKRKKGEVFPRGDPQFLEETREGEALCVGKLHEE